MLKSTFIYTRYAWCLFLFPLFTGCSSSKPAASRPTVIYPAPPDTARIIYLTSFSTATDITGKRSGLNKTVLGDQPVLSIGKPYGVGSLAGKLFICDAGIKGLEVVDYERKKMTPFVPSGKGQLRLPINCHADSMDGRLYVADVERKEVVIFDRELNYVSAIGRADTANNFKPMDVCSSSDKLWVTNPATHKVLVYQKSDLKLLRTIPDYAPGDPGFLHNPINIFYRNQKIYVTDFGDFRIKIFDENGKFLASVGEYGKQVGQFVRPKGIAVDRNDILYTVDAGFENVQLFNNKGKLLLFFGGPYKSAGGMWLPAKVHIDYDNISYFKKWIQPEYEIDYLLVVSNQYGPDKISVYGAIRHSQNK